MRRLATVLGPVGLVLLTVGAGWAVLAPRVLPTAYRGLIVAGLVALVPSAWGWRAALRDPVGGKRVRFGANALAAVSVATAAVLLVNFFSVRFHQRWDLTRTKSFSLHPVTIRILEGIDRDVDVVGLYPERRQTEFRAIRELYRIYSYHQPRIQVTVVDPQKRPDLVQELGVRGTRITVVRCGDRLAYFQDPGNAVDRERRLTAAIREVTRGEPKVVYWMYGHGERRRDAEGEEGFQQFQRSLEEDFYEVRDLSLGPGARVPDDASLLIFADPADPIPEEEVAALDAYLRRGGRILALADIEPGGGATAPPPLAELMRRWGMRSPPGIVVDPRPEKSSRYPEPWVVLGEDFGGAEPVAPLRGKETLFRGARALEFFTVMEDQQIFHMPLVRAGVGAYVEEDVQRAMRGEPDPEAQAEWRDTPPILALAAYRRFEPRPGQAGAGWEARFAVVGDADFLDNADYPARANTDFAENLVRWLTGEELLIRKEGERRLAKQALAIGPPRQQAVWLGVVLQFLVVFLAGWAIWFVRRSK
ncbi:MAG: hypothetical protein D6718_01460 [Acidobacteria bacterium]|nr:MAG: hypothetical protein D6718_01460 [Acidobacteriota bacterium]